MILDAVSMIDSSRYHALCSHHYGVPEKSDLSRLTPLVMVFTIPLCKVLAPPVTAMGLILEYDVNF
jgi:hypothetical protein